MLQKKKTRNGLPSRVVESCAASCGYISSYPRGIVLSQQQQQHAAAASAYFIGIQSSSDQRAVKTLFPARRVAIGERCRCLV
ncbi:MAG: hypothetical protein WBV06_00465 [Acidimicrobiia bacterium]